MALRFLSPLPLHEPAPRHVLGVVEPGRSGTHTKQL